MTKQQQIDTLQKQLEAANEQIATIDNALNAIHGGTKYDFSPADLYGQAVMSEYLKQQCQEDNNESE